MMRSSLSRLAVSTSNVASRGVATNTSSSSGQFYYIMNIPYGQLSAKLPVILSLSHTVIQSSSHPVILSSCHPVIMSSCHHHITLLYSTLLDNILTNNIRTSRSALQAMIHRHNNISLISLGDRPIHRNRPTAAWEPDKAQPSLVRRLQWACWGGLEGAEAY